MMVIVVVKDGVLRMIFEVVGAKMASRGQKMALSVKKRLREVENGFGASNLRLRELKSGFGVSKVASRGFAP